MGGFLHSIVRRATALFKPPIAEAQLDRFVARAQEEIQEERALARESHERGAHALTRRALTARFLHPEPPAKAIAPLSDPFRARLEVHKRAIGPHTEREIERDDARGFGHDL